MSRLPLPEDRRDQPRANPAVADRVFALLGEWTALQVSLEAHDAREPRGWRLRARREWLADTELLETERRELLEQFAALGASTLAAYGVALR